MPPIIEVNNATKRFPSRRGGRALVGRGGLQQWITGKKTDEFTALRDISFTVEPGESVGIIGSNGSGKSTLLKLIAGVTVPSEGEVCVNGRIASLLELGAGFHPMLTGRENIYLNAGLLGVRHKDTRKLFDTIVDFSGIGEFVDNPVTTYSSGMYVRLGFAVAVNSNPDIFLVDEVLAVGDEAFQRKCRQRINELKAEGKTIVFVSHDLGLVNTLCERVILLAKGEMVQRSTPQATIEYYLRQVGAARGTHVIRKDGIEAVVSNGRISIFKDEQEVTAAGGCQITLVSMEQPHYSPSGTWDVYETGADYCKIRGEMPRIPVTFDWHVRIENGEVLWTIELECMHEFNLDLIDVPMLLPLEYKQWLYSGLEGEFPELMPADTTWSTIAASEAVCREAAAFSEADSNVPPMAAILEPDVPYLRFQWGNTDFSTGARVLHATGRVPAAQNPLPAGRHRLGTIHLNFSASESDIRQSEVARRVLESGPLQARFDEGSVVLSYDHKIITRSPHMYASLLIGNLWNDSTTLAWGSPTSEDGGLRISAESRRHPFGLHWSFMMQEDGLHFQMELEAFEKLEIQEYQLSVLLNEQYRNWQTDHESGEFPPFQNGTDLWKHANKDYAPGRYISASAEALPAVTLEVSPDGPPFRMTAINTGEYHTARVIQALRTPDLAHMHFEPGRYVYAAGVIKVAPKKGRE